MTRIALAALLAGWIAAPSLAADEQGSGAPPAPTQVAGDTAALQRKVAELEATVRLQAATIEGLKSRSGVPFNERDAPGPVLAGATGKNRAPVLMNPPQARHKSSVPSPAGKDEEDGGSGGVKAPKGLFLLGGAVVGSALGALGASYISPALMLAGALSGGLIGIGVGYFLMKRDYGTALAAMTGALIGGAVAGPIGALVGGFIGMAVGKLFGAFSPSPKPKG